MLRNFGWAASVMLELGQSRPDSWDCLLLSLGCFGSQDALGQSRPDSLDCRFHIPSARFLNPPPLSKNPKQNNPESQTAPKCLVNKGKGASTHADIDVYTQTRTDIRRDTQPCLTWLARAQAFACRHACANVRHGITACMRTPM